MLGNRRTKIKLSSVSAYLVAACVAILIGMETGLADDGVFEINQACASGDGCFSGDVPGFPVQITSPGSYRLTGNLDLPTDDSGIEVRASDVQLDLNGFAIVGPITCSGTPVTSCSDSALFTWGVFADPVTDITDVTVEDGVVRGFTANGIDLGDRSTVRDINVLENRAEGISVSADSTIRNVKVRRNLLAGVAGLENTIVSSSHASGNGEDGFDLGAQAVVTDSIAYRNGDDGISANEASVIRNVMVRDNLNRGIGLFNTGSVVTSSAVNSNEGPGIDCSTFGQGTGLNNVVMNVNNGGTGEDQFVGDCREMGQNICGGDTTCP